MEPVYDARKLNSLIMEHFYTDEELRSKAEEIFNTNSSKYLARDFANYPEEVRKELAIRSIEKSLLQKRQIPDTHPGHESENNASYYKALFDQSNSVTLVIEADTGKILQANHAAEKFYQYEHQALEGSYFWRLTKAGKNAVKRMLQRVQRHRKMCFFARHVLADGSIRYTETYWSLINHKGQEFIHAVIHDITERLQQNKKLADEYKQLMAIFSGMDQAIYVADIGNYDILYANDAFIKRFGSQAIKQKCYKFIHNYDQPCSFCSNPIIHKQKSVYNWEQYHNESKAHYYMIDKAIRWTNGRDARFSMAIDITRLKHTEAENKKLSAAVEQNPASIVMTDPDGIIEYVNPAFTHNTGYSQHEAVGSNPRILKSGKTGKKVYKELWATIKQGKVWQGTFINRHKNGEECHEEAVITPILDDNNQISHFLSIKSDVTRRVKAEQSLKKSEADLRAANAAKDKFFSIIAHDLKNPFNALLGLVQVLMQRHRNYSPEKIDNYLQSIYESSRLNYNLLENLLVWSRAQSGKINYNPEIKMVKTLVHESVDLLTENARQKNVQIEAYLPADLFVWVDANMFRSVMRNLVANALKFTQAGGKVSLSAQKAGDMVEFAVADTGAGIPKEHVPKLFRIDEAYSTRGTANESGTGLGLVLCDEFVRLNKGSIWVESEVDKGSTFYFTAPFAKYNQAEVCSDILRKLRENFEADGKFREAFYSYLGAMLQKLSHGFSSYGIDQFLHAIEALQQKHYKEVTALIYQTIKHCRKGHNLLDLQHCLQELTEALRQPS